jgi:hypothetical protein
LAHQPRYESTDQATMPEAEAQARLARAAAIFARAAVRVATRARRNELAAVSDGAGSVASGNAEASGCRERDMPRVAETCVSEGWFEA